MGTWNAFYIAATSDNAAAIEALRESWPDAEIESSTQFLGVALPPNDFTPPEETLSALSSRLHTDVLWLSFQSLVDAFQFHHWRDGIHLRALVYGCYEERTWECAEGSPEPWERGIFFSQKRLDEALEYAEPGERPELKRIWREGDIAAGRTAPALNSRGCAHEIAAFYGLPGY